MQDDIYNPEYVKGLFNRMSTSYERMNYITSFGFSIRWRTQFLQPLKITKEPVEVIDLLTGMGETWRGVKKRFPAANITAVDFSEGMLKYARKKSELKFGGSIRFLQEDVLNNRLPSNHYDFVICAFGLKTFSTEQMAVLANETKRILKSGGQFSFIEVSAPSNSVLNFFYRIYLGSLVPILGRLFLGNPREYRMLWQYTMRFGDSKKTEEIFNAAGLQTQYNTYFYGCASGVSGTKEH